MSLTKALLDSDPQAYKAAMQHPFLSHAAQGIVPKALLGPWLASNRLFIHAYIRALGTLVSTLSLPADAHAPPDSNAKLLKWVLDALVALHREEGFVADLSRRYDIDVSRVAANPGLTRFEALFSSLSFPRDAARPIPWLEAAVVFWGVEKCYLDAWSWAASKSGPQDGSDADGGALRKEMMPHLSSESFAGFVDALGVILDEAVEQEKGGVDGVLDRARGVWRHFLQAEEAFWPDVSKE